MAGIDADAGPDVDRGRDLVDEVEPGLDHALGSSKWNITPSPSHFTGFPPRGWTVSRTIVASRSASSTPASSPRSSVSAVYPVRSRRRSPEDEERSLRDEAELLECPRCSGQLRPGARAPGAGRGAEHQLLAQAHDLVPHLAGRPPHLVVRGPASEAARRSCCSQARDPKRRPCNVLPVDPRQPGELVVFCVRPHACTSRRGRGRRPPSCFRFLGQRQTELSDGRRISSGERAGRDGKLSEVCDSSAGSGRRGGGSRRRASRRNAASDHIEVDPRVLERLHEKHTMDVLGIEGAVLGAPDENAQVIELLYPLGRAARCVRRSRGGKPHRASVLAVALGCAERSSARRAPRRRRAADLGRRNDQP